MAGDVVSVGAVTVKYVHDDPGSGYALLSWSAPPGTPGPPVHVHHHTEEGFYVVSGTYRFLIGDETVERGAGEHVLVRPEVAHTLWNAGDVLAVTLIVLTPGGFAAYFRELSAALANATGDDAAVEVRRALASRFDIEVVGG
jgi:mannose-6-phosphate isomerase-like protein (cupin superfamily)